MYEVFYKLKAEPFRLSPDHKFCFGHKGYAKAQAYMVYAFRRAEGFVMITGRPGTGKTTLIGELVESLSRDEVFTANLVCTQLQADDLLKTVAYSFGIGSARLDKAELLQRLTVLFRRWHREGRRALLIVDEAQDLSASGMEELRLLTNIQIGGQPLLQIFLLGQPELRDLIHSADMEQVHQRIVAASHIEGLQAEHLAVGMEFSPDDFEVSKETEWVVVPAAKFHERAEVHLHTINTDSVVETDLAAGADEQKKRHFQRSYSFAASSG
jgi:type II secretory pathway predicted ATPase ExeA